MIRVGRVGEEGAVFIGRPSSLGNPFMIGIHGGRDRVCEQYEAWFEARLMERDILILGTLTKLVECSRKGDLVLACYCAPLRCHGDTIKRFLEDDARVEEILGVPSPPL